MPQDKDKIAKLKKDIADSNNVVEILHYICDILLDEIEVFE